MASPVVLTSSQDPLADPLAYLPYSTIAEYERGQVIYEQNQPSTNLYLVIAGQVEVSCLSGAGQRVVIDLYQTDEFFGESGFVGMADCVEQVTAVEHTLVMVWSIAAVEQLLMKQPGLAIALMQLQVRRILDFRTRVESFSVDCIARRLARTLIRFSKRRSERVDDGAVRLGPLTHELLAQFVG